MNAAMLKKIIFIFFCLFLSSPLFAIKPSVMTVGDLKQICSGSDQEAKTACKFYIMGYVQGASTSLPRKPCLPENYTFSSVQESVTTKMAALITKYPRSVNLEASGALSGILVSLYTCPNT